MTRTDIINFFIEKYNFNTYLEIGYDRGVNFNNIHIHHKESVDPAMGGYSHATPTHKMTSDDFFEKNKTKFDIIFIDGLHESQQVDRDIINSINSLNAGGVVVLHDCNPLEEIIQRVPRQNAFWLGDVWKSFVRYSHSDTTEYKCYTIDTDCGCGVIDTNLKCDSKIDIPSDLNFNWLDKNRKSALNLISVSSFKLLYESS